MSVQAVGFFCEDIRIEQSGASILVGLLPDNIYVPVIPSNIPKFSFYLRLHLPLTGKISSLKGRIEMPWGETIDIPEATSEAIAKAQEDAEKQTFAFAGFVLHGTIAIFPVKAPGRIDAFVTVDGQDYLCGSINIAAVPTSSASAPLSGQSQPAAPAS